MQDRSRRLGRLRELVAERVCTKHLSRFDSRRGFSVLVRAAARTRGSRRDLEDHLLPEVRRNQVQTYGEQPTPAPVGLDVKFTAQAIDKFELAEWLANVNYNCVSNGGTCFLPRDADEALTAWRLDLLRSLARVRAEGVHP